MFSQLLIIVRYVRCFLVERDSLIHMIVKVSTSVEVVNVLTWFVQTASFSTKTHINVDQVSLSSADHVRESISSNEVRAVDSAMEHVLSILTIVALTSNVEQVKALCKSASLATCSTQDHRNVLKLSWFSAAHASFHPKMRWKMWKIFFLLVRNVDFISAVILGIALDILFVKKVDWCNTFAQQDCISIREPSNVICQEMSTVWQLELLFHKHQFFPIAMKMTDFSQILQIVSSTMNASTLNRSWNFALPAECGIKQEKAAFQPIHKSAENPIFHE